MDHLFTPAFAGGVVAAIILGIVFLTMISWRVVVSTNVVHIVQKGKDTISYGTGQKHGNVYYKIPSWVPLFGVHVSELPVSVFSVKLDGYASYDINRLPFVIDLVAFFRISDTNMAAARVQNIQQLFDQLKSILQGAARTILATEPIDDILGQRAIFGVKFTDEVRDQLTQWGVEPVKSIELMDIRDEDGSKVIAQIMAKKKSEIDRDSRVAVAENARAAAIAETVAAQAVQVRKQEMEQAVGEREAMKKSAVGIASQKADEMVALQAKITTEASMEVERARTVKQAEITKDAQVVLAEQTKQIAIKTAEGDLQKATLGAQGIELNGAARATAEKLMLLAPVEAQVTLAEKIGANQPYQDYLIRVKTVEATKDVGIAQAEALKAADIKIVSSAASASEGINLVSLGNAVGTAINAFRDTSKKDVA